MSGNTVGQVLNQDMADKIGTNGQVANLIMGLIAKCVWEAARRGCPINGLKFGQVNVNGADITFNVQFNRLSGPSTGIVSVKSSVGDYVAAKSQNLAKCLAVNPAMLRTMEDVVKRIDGYCRYKGLAFADWRVGKAFLSREGTFVIRTEKSQKGRWE